MSVSWRRGGRQRNILATRRLQRFGRSHAPGGPAGYDAVRPTDLAMSSAQFDQSGTATGDQYRALFAVSDAIASHRDLPALLHELGGRLLRVVHFDALSVVLHDSTTD